ncbi:hypothetical protein BDZ91DRAFT_91705 [Kalaharituber pfeilii]|nr:hypothetical protein BDZ91DRAFT_91705 [Kalaharituber pfeilii]
MGCSSAKKDGDLPTPKIRLTKIFRESLSRKFFVNVPFLVWNEERRQLKESRSLTQRLKIAYQSHIAISLMRCCYSKTNKARNWARVGLLASSSCKKTSTITMPQVYVPIIEMVILILVPGLFCSPLLL